MIKWSYQVNDVITKSPRMVTKTQPILHSTPSVEYEFWNLRFTKLNNIYTQLMSNNIKTIGLILEATNSVYYQSFKLILKNTVKELNKARDIRIYLNALCPYTEIVQTTDFDKCKSLIRPLLNCTCKMWANTRFYTTTDWLRLFQMICNMLITESANNLDSTSIFQNEVDEELGRILCTIDILEYFK